MDVDEKDLDGIRALMPKGHIDSHNAKEFEDRVVRSIDAGATKVLIDFSDVEYISSAGLRVLLIAAKRLQSSGGKFAISSVQEKVLEIFEVAGFSRVLSIHDTQDAAIASMS